MTGVGGLGRWPGTDLVEAQRMVLEELVDTPPGVQGLPFIVRTNDRGPYGDWLGQAMALLVDLPAQVGPHGWALTDHPGQDLVRARETVGQMLDALAVAAFGYDGPLLVPVLGPVSSSAHLWSARGDRVVGDLGAAHEVAESSAVGLAEHLGAVRRAVPGALLQVVLVEPALDAVVGGRLPTFSGRDRLRAVEQPVVISWLSTVLSAARAAGAERTVVQVGHAVESLGLPTQAGADAVGVEVTAVDPHGWEQIAGLVEAGTGLWARVPVAGAPAGTRSSAVGQVSTVSRPWRRVGLSTSALAEVVLLGPSSASQTGPAHARAELSALVRAAQELAQT